MHLRTLQAFVSGLLVITNALRDSHIDLHHFYGASQGRLNLEPSQNAMHLQHLHAELQDRKSLEADKAKLQVVQQEVDIYLQKLTHEDWQQHLGGSTLHGVANSRSLGNLTAMSLNPFQLVAQLEKIAIFDEDVPMELPSHATRWQSARCILGKSTLADLVKQNIALERELSDLNAYFNISAKSLKSLVMEKPNDVNHIEEVEHAESQHKHEAGGEDEDVNDEVDRTKGQHDRETGG
eukprot:symbB.v1.2.036473.t1/scaffold5157.1/size30255/4